MPLTIDNLRPDSWPPDIITALDQWRQGHLSKVNSGRGFLLQVVMTR
jgi:hypothetical protein